MAIRTALSQESIDRFWAKVEKTDSCWLWTAALNEKGYGVFGVKKETDKAHRISWKLSKGPILNSLFVLHKCDIPNCVRPSHLFLGTNQDNVNDMIKKGRNSPPPSMGGWNRINIPEFIFPLLGKQPDTKIAKLIGVTKHTIQRLRKRKGIAVFSNAPLSTEGRK